MSTDHLNNALTSWSSGDEQGSDPTLYSQVGHSSTQDLHHSGMADINQNYGTDQFSGINDPGLINPDYHQPDYYQQPDYQQPDYQQPDYHQPDYHQPDYHQSVGYGGYGDNFQYSDRAYDLGNVGYEHQTLSFASQGTVLNCSSQSHSCVYTTISDNGQIYKYTEGQSGGDYVGHLNGRNVYNSSNSYLGYAGTDGKVYDNNDHCVGWVDGCHVYNKGGVEVYDTKKGVVGGAAYLLCVYYGGAN